MPFPRLLEPFLDSGVLSKADAVREVGEKAAENDLKYLRKAGYIHVVRKGLYALDRKRTGTTPDRYVLASKVREDTLLGYHTALELLGVAHSAFFDTIYGCMRKPVRPFSYDGTNYRFVAASEAWLTPAYYKRVKRAGDTVRVAGPELALVQCVQRLDFAGGLDEVLHSIEGFRKLDWRKLEQLVASEGGSTTRRENYGRAALARKLGFVAELNAARWNPPTAFLDAMQEHIGEGATYFGTTRERGSRWVGRWNLAVPKNLPQREES